MRHDDAIDHELDRLIVDPDDIITALDRNASRRANGRWIIRVPTPLEGVREAHLKFWEAGARYGGDGPKPLHLRPEAFLSGQCRDPQIPDEAAYPDRGLNRTECRDHHGIEPGAPIPDDLWDQWWDEVYGEWKASVRHHLAGSIEIGGEAVDVVYEPDGAGDA